MTIEALQDLLNKVENKNEWNQGGLFSEDASKVCLIGRLYMINDNAQKTAVKIALYRALRDQKYPYDLATYNDTHSHEDVVRLVTKAIEMESSKVSSQKRNA